jgi:hypothetical protein
LCSDIDTAASVYRALVKRQGLRGAVVPYERPAIIQRERITGTLAIIGSGTPPVDSVDE